MLCRCSVVLVGLACAGIASAVPVTLTAQLFLDEQEGPVVPTLEWIQPGETIDFTYEFDSTTPDSNPADGAGEFVNPLNFYIISLGTNSTNPVQLNDSSIMQSINEYQVVAQSQEGQGGGFRAQVTLQGGFDPDVLITDPAVFTNIGQSQAQLTFEFEDPSTNQEATTIFTGELVGIVPEPSSALLLLAAGALALRRRA